MSEEYLKNMLEIVDGMDEEQIIVLLATIANNRGINTYITKNTPIKMQVFNLEEERYGRVVERLGKFKFIKTSHAHN